MGHCPLGTYFLTTMSQRLKVYLGLRYLGASTNGSDHSCTILIPPILDSKQKQNLIPLSSAHSAPGVLLKLFIPIMDTVKKKRVFENVYSVVLTAPYYISSNVIGKSFLFRSLVVTILPTRSQYTNACYIIHCVRRYTSAHKTALTT